MAKILDKKSLFAKNRGTNMELEKSGLPVFLEGKKLVFGESMAQVKPTVRSFEQMKPVLMDKAAKGPAELYYMYRNVCLKEHEKKIFQNNLRYDLTVIPPARIGREFVKTFGHYHPIVPGGKVAFPEVYEVLFGTAHYFLQKEDDCIVVKATAGEKVIMPPGFGHITINPSKETLVMANWVEKNFESVYGPIKEKGGAMYFETVNPYIFSPKALQVNAWVKNENYGFHPQIRNINPVEFKEFDLVTGKPMYWLINKTEKLEFLKNPQNFGESFKKFVNPPTR